MIRLSHPNHGFKDAYTDAEAREDMANGWSVVEPQKAEEVKEDSLATDLRTQYIAKFGEAPHHRMSEKTIRAKLEE